MERKIKKVELIPPMLPKKKRVAAYCRVSSGKDAMLNSLSAQVSYYSDYIQRNKEWELVGIYSDEAFTGTKDTRPEFQRLLDDCRNGRVDMVITKSISRLARNTVTMLQTVRELKALNIDIFFEKENIHSTSGDGEFILTILASFAQEESRSVSESCKWRIRRKFPEGKATFVDILGYKWNDGTFEIVPDEAEIVRMIFNDYLSGMGKNAIVKKLRKNNIPTKRNSGWCESVIDKMLRNEKYMGDMLLQKFHCADHMTKIRTRNNGELPMYHVSESHEPIIDRATFELVQTELKRRSAQSNSTPKHNTYAFTGKIKCGNCGRNYVRRMRGDRPIWSCFTYDRFGKAHCASQAVPEDILNSLVEDIQISEICIPSPNKVNFVLANGDIIEKTWQYGERRSTK